jgi:hypothetical protein
MSQNWRLAFFVIWTGSETRSPLSMIVAGPISESWHTNLVRGQRIVMYRSRTRPVGQPRAIVGLEDEKQQRTAIQKTIGDQA